MATAETTVAAPKKSVMRSGAAQKLLAFGALIIIFANPFWNFAISQVGG